MINIVLIIILVVIVVLAIKSSVKHFSGEGACCGGGSGTLVEKKKLTLPIIEKKQVLIEGMKCSECSKKVWNGLNKIENLSVKKSNAKKGFVIYEASSHISEDEIKSVIENLGYKFVCIK